MDRLLTKLYHKAKQEGRLCTHCGWVVTVVDYDQGHRLCGNCRDALQGVRCKGGHLPYADERVDMTGEMD
jgi:hypothetical protein